MKVSNACKQADLKTGLLRFFWLLLCFIMLYAFMSILVIDLIASCLSYEGCDKTLVCRLLGTSFQELSHALTVVLPGIAALVITWAYSIIYDVMMIGKLRYDDADQCYMRLCLRSWIAISAIFFLHFSVKFPPYDGVATWLLLIIEIFASVFQGLVLVVLFDIFFCSALFHAFNHVYEKADEKDDTIIDFNIVDIKP